MKFHTIVIIYNPNSTGDSERNAKDCAEQLGQKVDGVTISVVATEFKAHGEEIAASYADDPGVLIISSSGDGGYNEVVNGVLLHGGKAAVAVLPSGNANDHHTALNSGALYEHIAAGQVTRIDTLLVETKVSNAVWKRYAHSYVGFGLTPSIGQVLTEQRPNIFTEKWYVIRHAVSFKSVKLIIDGKKRRYGSIVCSLIPQMSKVIKLDQESSVQDGKMEVYTTLHTSLLGLIKLVVKAAVQGVETSKRTSVFSVKTVKKTLIQLDGEVDMIDSNVDVTITCNQKQLTTVL